jgi:hypothetical protein
VVFGSSPKLFRAFWEAGRGERGADLGARGGCVRGRATGRRPPQGRQRGAPWEPVDGGAPWEPVDGGAPAEQTQPEIGDVG